MYEYLRDKSVLYVEDEIEVLNNISRLLSKFFKNFYTATDGLSALDIFYEHDIDILLVDIELPKLNGIELIREIRKVNEDVKIIIISAYTKTDYLLESVELGLSKYIVKPLTSSKIHMILKTINDYYASHDSFYICNIEINKNNYLLKYKDTEYELNKKELKLLDMLSQKRVITYDEINELWIEAIPSENAIRSFIKYLRKKLPKDMLKNKSGVGYYIECPDEKIH